MLQYSGCRQHFCLPLRWGYYFPSTFSHRKESRFSPILHPYVPRNAQGGRTADCSQHKTLSLGFRADFGNSSVLFGQTMIFLPSSGTEPTSRKPVRARRHGSSEGLWHSPLHRQGAAHPRQLGVPSWGCPAPALPHTTGARLCRAPCQSLALLLRLPPFLLALAQQ